MSRSSIEQRVIDLEDGITSKQDALVSGTNIKTINGSSLLGSGNLSVGGGSFSGTMDDIPDGTTYVKTENNLTDAEKTILSNTSGTNSGDETASSIKTKLGITTLSGSNTGDQDLTSYLTSATAASTYQPIGTYATGTGTANGTNTGDQTSIVGISGTKANFDSACTDGNFLYVGDVTQYADENAQDAVGAMVDTTLVYTDATPLLSRAALTGAITASAGSNTTALGSFTKSQLDTAVSDGNVLYVGDIVDAVADGATKGIATFETNDFNSTSGKIGIDYTNGQSASGSTKGFLTSADWTTFNGKQDALTNGYGLTGTTTKAVSLTTSSAFVTGETTISAVTYADITGASITLAAGTWLLMATINGASQTTTVAVMMCAITDGANTVIVEGSQHIPAGTATVRTWGNLSLNAIVSPVGSTTYKLRGARGTTTQTGNWIASDGNGVNTVNNVSNNTDKSTCLMAIRIA